VADQRISQLTELAQADVAADDVLAIVDIGASTTKKVQAKKLFQAGANLADASSIDLDKLNQASTTKLGTTALADDAVTAAKLADDSSIVFDSVTPTTDNFEGRGYVNSSTNYLQVWNGSAFVQVKAPTAGIDDLAITTGKLADNAVTTAKVDASGLAAAALATDSVITAKIQDLAVTTGKLAALSVTTAKIAADAVTADELASDAVVTASIVDANVTEAKLATGAVTEAKIGTAAVTVTKIADTSITAAKLNLADGSVPGAKLTDATVTSAKLASDAVITGSITDLNVTTGKLADGAVTAAKITDATITTAKIAAGGLAEAAIATDAITTGKILDAAITATKMADDSVVIVSAGTPIGSGDFEGQGWFDTNTSVRYVWDGAAWIRQAAINTITFSDTTPLASQLPIPITIRL
jgi:trimeric autotransporter adhesin